jgi:hypothetical protein
VIAALYVACLLISLASLAVVTRPRPVSALRPVAGTRQVTVRVDLDGRAYVGELTLDTAA